MQALDALRRCPLFAVLPEKALDAWLLAGEVLTVETGQTLLEADTSGHHAYVVLSGRIRVLRPRKDEREIVLGTLLPGDVFGEYALLRPHHNTATCRVSEAGQVLRLPLAPLRMFVTRIPELGEHLKNWLRLHALLGYLRQGPFLGFLTATSVLPLHDRCTPATFPAGHTIQASGLAADRWFIVQTGAVALLPDGPGATPRTVGPGESFGEGALCGQIALPRAVAQCDTTCLYLLREHFLQPLNGAVPSVLQTARTVVEQRRRAYEWVAQREPADCGVASLTMALRRHRAEITLEQVRALTPLSGRGASLEGLEQTATQLGFRATAVRIGLQQLAAISPPAVAHLGHGHYVTLFEVSPFALVIGDPAAGVVTWNWEAFQQAWSGNLLTLVPERGGGGA